MKGMRVVVCAALAGLLLLGAGCARIVSPGPKEVARDWYAAVGEFDTVAMYGLTHPERRATLEAALENPLVTLGAVVGLQKQTFFDMAYEVALKQGDIAQVRAVGRCANRLGMIEELDEVLDLRRLDGRWYVWYAADDY